MGVTQFWFLRKIPRGLKVREIWYHEIREAVLLFSENDLHHFIQLDLIEISPYLPITDFATNLSANPERMTPISISPTNGNLNKSPMGP